MFGFKNVFGHIKNLSQPLLFLQQKGAGPFDANEGQQQTYCLKW